MKLNNIKTLARASMITLALGLAAAPASADGLEDWLRDTFSTDDFVGDWLRDMFGPVQNDGKPFDSPSLEAKGYREAVEIMAEWPRSMEGRKMERAKVVQICDGEKLLNVVLETKSLEKTTGTCFK